MAVDLVGNDSEPLPRAGYNRASNFAFQRKPLRGSPELGC